MNGVHVELTRPGKVSCYSGLFPTAAGRPPCTGGRPQVFDCSLGRRRPTTAGHLQQNLKIKIIFKN